MVALLLSWGRVVVSWAAGTAFEMGKTEILYVARRRRQPGSESLGFFDKYGVWVVIRLVLLGRCDKAVTRVAQGSFIPHVEGWQMR